MGEVGDSKEERGTFLGGRRKSRLDESRRGVVRDVHALQNTPPHLRQCWVWDEVGQREGVRGRATYMSAFENREADAAVKIVALGGEGIWLPEVFWKEDGEVLVLSCG